MSRYIDEISARENFQDVLAYMGSEVKRMLKKIPTADVVEVVRCKDCKHFKDEGTDGQYCQYHTKSAGENCDGAFWVAKNDFCSYGERREV